MVSNEELRRALRLCVEQMCARCREAADAMTSSIPCLEGCETLKIAKAALAADDAAARKGELSKIASKNGADFGQFGNETLADIVREMRGNEFDDPHLDADGIIGVRILAKGWAARLEAVAKRAYHDIYMSVCSMGCVNVDNVRMAINRTLGGYYE